jgi:hypothetical protein
MSSRDLKLRKAPGVRINPGAVRALAAAIDVDRADQVNRSILRP